MIACPGPRAEASDSPRCSVVERFEPIFNAGPASQRSNHKGQFARVKETERSAVEKSPNRAMTMAAGQNAPPRAIGEAGEVASYRQNGASNESGLFCNRLTRSRR